MLKGQSVQINYSVIVEIKKTVPWEECVIARKYSNQATIPPPRMENSQEQKVFIGISAEH